MASATFIWSLSVLLLLTDLGLVLSYSITAVFSETNGHGLQHLVVNKESNLVYVGGVNRLFQLSPDLERQVTVETGPREDNLQCPASGCSDDVTTQLTDNVNKALVVDPYHNQLIVCGTLHQGACSVRSLENIGDELMEVREAVVANTLTDSTVAFIAPGPPNPPKTHVLYVGVTYTNNSPFRIDVPAVSSRSLVGDETFQIVEKDVTRLYLNQKFRAQYPIYYVYGFSLGGFSYFLTNQKRNTANNSPYISKLARVCQEDPDNYSYTEVPIECVSKGNEKYNLVQAAFIGKPGRHLAGYLEVSAEADVLFVVFAQDDSTGVSNRPLARSALCVFSFEHIRRKFGHAIQGCANGQGERELDYFSERSRCVRTTLELHKDDYCALGGISPLGGNAPISERLIYKTNDTLMTAVAVNSVGDSTVFFFGTSNGRVKKVSLGEMTKREIEYFEKYIIVDEGSSVSSDMVFDWEHNHLYVMTERKVTKIPVQQCQVYRTCGECLGAKDPLCGWCSLENKCSLIGECKEEESYSIHWMSYNTEDTDGADDSKKWKQCIVVTSVRPNQIERNSPGAHTLALMIDNIPSIAGQLDCAFSAFGKTLLTKAFRTGNGLRCTTPLRDEIPAIPPGQHQFTAQLSTSCTECVYSPNGCDWCSLLRRCTTESEENCPYDRIIKRITQRYPRIQNTQASCPGRSEMTIEPSEILVHHGMKKGVKVKLKNVVQSIAQTNLICQFNIEGRVTQMGARFQDDFILCDEMSFAYYSRVPTITATLTVIWGESKAIDKPQNIIIYRCSEMADSCSRCLGLANKYLCGWCQTSDKCEVREQCDQNGGSMSVTTGSNWLNRNESCFTNFKERQVIEVNHFYPKIGPLEGGTNVTIEGVNLGKTFTDLTGGITVAGIPCRPYEELYVQTKRIVCLVGSAITSKSRRGPVVVTVSNSKAESVDVYEFVDPIIESIHPTSGPMSGGTKLTIRGQFLNAGSSIKAFIEPALPCPIIYTNGSYVICQTSASTLPRNGELLMTFDNGVRRFTRQVFQYVEDIKIPQPELGVVNHASAPKGVPSGGTIISVSGSNLRTIENPQMFIRYQGVLYSGNCQVITDEFMECQSPSVAVPEQELSSNEPLSLDYGFIINDVAQPVPNLSNYSNFPKFHLYPDPIFEKFEGELMDFNSNDLIINGTNLDLAFQEKDVEVKIETTPCNVTSLSRHQLKCRLPTNLAPSAGSNHCEVVVQVGRNLRYTIGKLSYGSPIADEDTLPNFVIICVAIVGGVLVFSFMSAIVVMAYRRLSTRNSNNQQRRKPSDDQSSHSNNYTRTQTVSRAEAAEQMSRANTQNTQRSTTNHSQSDQPNAELSTDDGQTGPSPYDKRWEFPMHRLKFGKQIGSGCFGRVFKAEAVGLRNCSGTLKTVAVKMVRSKRNIVALEALERELKILIHLGWHLNVLNLLGACTIGKPQGELFIITEYCRFGNLQTYIVENRCNFINQLDESGNYIPDNETETSHNLPSGQSACYGQVKGKRRRPNSMQNLDGIQTLETDVDDPLELPSKWRYQADPDADLIRPIYTRDLMSWSLQIARGMKYLARKEIRHGDLAARNILLAENGVVKIADFGMARNMQSDEDCGMECGSLPVRWMALESLTHKIFSLQSDVWSYGIVLWELFTLGRNPYPGINDKDLAEEIGNGFRLKKPNFAPNFLDVVMRDCWKANSEERPTFSDIEKIIKEQTEKSVSSYYCNLNVPYEESNRKRENASMTESFGLARLLKDKPKLKKSQSSVS